MSKEEMIRDFTNLLFSCYFEERSENEIVVKFDNFIVKRESKNNVSLKDDICSLLRVYSRYLVNQFYDILSDKKFYKNLEKLLKNGMSNENFGLMASGSYRLIGYKNGAYWRSRSIIPVLKEFRYNRKNMQVTRILPSFQALEEDGKQVNYF